MWSVWERIYLHAEPTDPFLHACVITGESEEIVIELEPDKTNKMTCVPSKDSDQPGHMFSLFSDFAVCMKKGLVLSYP